MPAYDTLSDEELIDNLIGVDEDMNNHDKRMKDWDLEFTDSIIGNPSLNLSSNQRKHVIRILRQY